MRPAFLRLGKRADKRACRGLRRVMVAAQRKDADPRVVQRLPEQRPRILADLAVRHGVGPSGHRRHVVDAAAVAVVHQVTHMHDELDAAVDELPVHLVDDVGRAGIGVLPVVGIDPLRVAHDAELPGILRWHGRRDRGRARWRRRAGSRRAAAPPPPPPPPQPARGIVAATAPAPAAVRLMNSRRLIPVAIDSSFSSCFDIAHSLRNGRRPPPHACFRRTNFHPSAGRFHCPRRARCETAHVDRGQSRCKCPASLRRYAVSLTTPSRLSVTVAGAAAVTWQRSVNGTPIAGLLTGVLLSTCLHATRDLDDLEEARAAGAARTDVRRTH